MKKFYETSKLAYILLHADVFFLYLTFSFSWIRLYIEFIRRQILFFFLDYTILNARNFYFLYYLSYSTKQSHNKLLSSMPRKRSWDNDLVRIVDKKSIKKSNLNLWHEAKLKLFKLHSKKKFTTHYVERRYFRARSISFIILYFYADVEKLKNYLNLVLLFQRLHAFQNSYSLKNRRLR